MECRSRNNLVIKSLVLFAVDDFMPLPWKIIRSHDLVAYMISAGYRGH